MLAAAGAAGLCAGMLISLVVMWACDTIGPRVLGNGATDPEEGQTWHVIVRDEFPIDLDGDGVLDPISIVSEKKGTWVDVYLINCRSKWYSTLIVTKGGSDGSVILYQVAWCAEKPVRAWGRLEDGTFIVVDDLVRVMHFLPKHPPTAEEIREHRK